MYIVCICVCHYSENSNHWKIKYVKVKLSLIPYYFYKVLNQSIIIYKLYIKFLFLITYT